jgi:hypothetical protein
LQVSLALKSKKQKAKSKKQKEPRQDESFLGGFLA